MQKSLPSDHKIEIVTHPPCSLNDLTFIVATHLYSLEGHAQIEAEFRKVCRVRINGLTRIGSAEGTGHNELIAKAHLPSKNLVPNNNASCGVYHTLAFFFWRDHYVAPG